MERGRNVGSDLAVIGIEPFAFATGYFGMPEQTAQVDRNLTTVGDQLHRTLDWKGAFWLASGVPALVLISIVPVYLAQRLSGDAAGGGRI